jgi:pyrroloquinoline-quinone synthase
MSDQFTDAKDFLLQNMYEEELADIRHTDLLIKFAEACGTTRERVEDPSNMNPVTRGLQAWCYAVAMREHPVVATAALVIGLESQVPSIYKKQIVPLREVYGFTEDEIEFFDLHITSDEVHGERGYQIVLDCATTPELQERSIELCRWGADMRFSYTKALYDYYVKPDLGES